MKELWKAERKNMLHERLRWLVAALFLVICVTAALTCALVGHRDAAQRPDTTLATENFIEAWNQICLSIGRDDLLKPTASGNAAYGGQSTDELIAQMQQWFYVLYSLPEDAQIVMTDATMLRGKIDNVPALNYLVFCGYAAIAYIAAASYFAFDRKRRKSALPDPDASAKDKSLVRFRALVAELSAVWGILCVIGAFLLIASPNAYLVSDQPHFYALPIWAVYLVQCLSQYALIVTVAAFGFALRRYCKITALNVLLPPLLCGAIIGIAHAVFRPSLPPIAADLAFIVPIVGPSYFCGQSALHGILIAAEHLALIALFLWLAVRGLDRTDAARQDERPSGARQSVRPR